MTFFLVCLLPLAMGLLCEEQVEREEILAEIKKGRLVWEGVYYGDLHARKSEEIYAPKPHEIWTMTVDTVIPDGTIVEKGDTVLTFVRDPIEEALASEEAKLQVDKAKLSRLEHRLDKEKIDLELNVKRRRMALERAKLEVVEGVNLISKLELEKAKLDVEKAEILLNLDTKALAMFEQKRKTTLEVERVRMKTRQRRVEDKKKALKLMEVKATAAGVLYAPYTTLNWKRDKVAPGKVVFRGDKILEIPDLGSYDAHVYIRQRDAIFIKVGDRATVYPAVLPNKPIVGMVARKESFATTRNERLGTKTPQGNLKELLVVVELEEAPDLLRPGGSVKVEIEATLAEDVVQVPLIGVHEDGGSQYVMMPGGVRREIETGQTTLTHAEVKAGLREGDKISLSRGR